MYKRNCSNCNIEIEVDERSGYRSGLIFCSTKCHYEFTDRDSKMRKKLNWDDLK